MTVFLPKYDKLTEFYASLNLDFDGGSTFFGDQASSENFNNTGPRVVFFGHGTEQELLTAPGLGTSSHTFWHDKLADSDVIKKASIERLVAYCCSAATKLGKDVTNSGGEFVGFNEEFSVICIRDPIVQETYRDVIKYLIEHYNVEIEILIEGIYSKYEELLKKFEKGGAHENHPKAKLIRQSLLEQREYLV